MKQLTADELKNLAGSYFSPKGLYRYIKELPFLGTVYCDTKTLVAGEWTEVVITYTVGGSGLADGAWIKGTFKFYSDWALLQTSDPRAANFVSAEYQPAILLPGQSSATVQSLSVRFDQKGHERPFQKAIIIDIMDGFLNPGDKIIVRIGDRRYGAKGTRVQTFVEKNFQMRWYIDPVGTSRFAAIKPDISIDIVSGAIAKMKIITPRVVRPDVVFPLHIHTEDLWGNTSTNQTDMKARVRITGTSSPTNVMMERLLPLERDGWTHTTVFLSLSETGSYQITGVVLDANDKPLVAQTEYLAVRRDIPVPRILFGDLHVHSDDTVGTNSSIYNFSYGRDIAGLDVLGYTANDFNISEPRWNATVCLIRELYEPGTFVIFAGTEWCGNSAVGGDHNVIFLDDSDYEFPFDREGNVSRSFEWNENGPAELIPGAWPLDEVYATYAHAPEKHLLIPHVGGRRCNLAWHHPQLERLLEVGSAWGQFEWLLQDAVARGWRLGVCANSDEHRGRCGGGVPGTAVFGTKGGLTGVLASTLTRDGVANTLRARHTFATTGERLVGIASTKNAHLQGDDIELAAGEDLDINFNFFGGSGFSSIEAWDATGIIWERDLIEEGLSTSTTRKLLVEWGGARLYDRYREAVWDGRIMADENVRITNIQPFGGVVDVPEDVIALTSEHDIEFHTRTSGDLDGVLLEFNAGDKIPTAISVGGNLGGYVKVGDSLKGNPHQAQPTFCYDVVIADLPRGGQRFELAGGAGLFIRVRIVGDELLHRELDGRFTVNGKEQGAQQSVYLVAREWNGGKVITSPMFLDWK